MLTYSYQYGMLIAVKGVTAHEKEIRRERGKMKKKLAIGLIASTLLLSGCQSITRSFGGEQVINIPAGKKLVPYTVQWEKNDDLWYLTEDMQEGDSPKTYIFYESSNLGELEGSVRFIEHKKGE